MTTNPAASAEELKKYLKDAGMYEENMNYEDMFNYYNVLKCSESTAQLEQRQRSITEDMGDAVKSKDSHSLLDSNFSDGSVSDNESNNDESSASVSPKLNKKTITPKIFKSKFALLKSDEASASKTPQNNDSSLEEEDSIEYDVFDCLTAKQKSLDIILYERKYDLPPYCNPKYKKLSISQRAKIICNFHRAILDRFYKLHCESINPAPWGKPIPASDKFSGSLDRNTEDEDNELEFVLSNEEENANNVEVYTSRSGRQTKRKLYTDAFIDENDLKKSKKNIDKPFEIEKKSVTKRQYFNKVSNQDIMKRSKLFAEPAKSTRSEKLFDLLKDGDNKKVTVNKKDSENKKESEDKKETENKKGSENKVTVDKRTERISDDIKTPAEVSNDIIPSSQESMSSYDEVEFVSTSPAFIPRRVPPPSRARRAMGFRRLAASADKTKLNASPHTSVTTPKATPSSPAVLTPEPKPKSMVGKSKCPICSQIFFQEEIETHASSCGLGMETSSNFDVLLPTGSVKKISCNICDKEFFLNKDYEVHVKECITRQKRNDSM